MRVPAAIALTIGLLLIAAVSAAEDAAKTELKKLNGTWLITSEQREGPLADSDKNGRVLLSGNLFATEVGDKVVRRGTLKLDPTQKPKTIDLTYTEGEFKGKTLQGIYSLEGTTWKICYGLPGEERPKELPKKPGKGQVLLTLQRAAP